MSSTPKPKQNSSAIHGARVLTSLEAIALMEAKEKKKQDELEAKENRKIEKKQQNEVEMKRERECKVAARKQMAMEKEVEKKRKAELHLQNQTEKKSSETSRTASRRSHAISQARDTTTSGITLSEVSDQNVCYVCLGTYEDNFVSRILQREWICCTNLEDWIMDAL